MTHGEFENSPSVLELESVTKRFASSTSGLVLDHLSFSLHKGEFLSIVGPSGCGKSTLLRLMAGLLPISSGKILVNNQSTNLIGESVMVFQEYNRSLLPWRNVLANVEFGLEPRENDSEKRKSVAMEFLQLVGLHDFVDFFPWQLSGGMQQRVAIARALACRPKVLLMDEPFGALDAKTKSDLEDSLLRIWDALQLSVVFVTHDIDEAIYLGSRVLVLTTKPAQIKYDENVQLAYPRDQLETKQAPRFLELRSKLYKALKSEDS